ncbi:response regulator transcription factor [Paraliomyxa miuraensis]|uniref:response regulator transcription factor n=1 Tax=Paraliomyxa miuraensis TaxID=376150 RepID=UPI00225B04DC|nr:response regulator transcription factor [Paraliomyxa miuraensis]MCX4239275.1 response regulator transcription factor [Paraliomyxa miuraensis]
MIRVMLTEDQELVLGALAALLELEGDLSVVARARDGRDALEQLGRCEVDVLVTDIEMPRMNGLELSAAVRARHPSVKVVVLTTFARPGYLKRAMESGAHAYLLKDGPAQSLAAAIRSVVAGGKVVDPQLAAEAWSESDPLSHREKQVLRHSEAGLTTKQISTELDLSEGTVRNYLSSAIGKLEAANRFEAASRARSKGWL